MLASLVALCVGLACAATERVQVPFILLGTLYWQTDAQCHLVKSFDGIFTPFGVLALGYN